MNQHIEPMEPEYAALLDVERTQAHVPADAKRRVWIRFVATTGVSVVAAWLVAHLAKWLLRIGAWSKPAVATLAFSAGVATTTVTYVVVERAATSATSKPAVRAQNTEQVPTLSKPPGVDSPTEQTAAPIAPPTSVSKHTHRSLIPAEASPPHSAPAAAVAPLTNTTTSQFPVDSALRRERVVLERASSALARGNAVGALSALEEHERSFPEGQLAEERDALRIRALFLGNRSDDARRALEKFKREYPLSLLLPSE